MRHAIVTLLISLLGLMLVFLFKKIFQMELRSLLVDIAVVGKVSPISGFLSNLGMLLWCTTAAISMFTAILVYRIVNFRKFMFFLYGSLFTISLLLDDLYMFHDHMIKIFFGAREEIFYAGYIVFAVVYVIIFKKEIFQSNYFTLFVALGLMGASITCDYLTDISILIAGKWEYLVEDGLKWFGIVWWCSYFVQTSYSTIYLMINNSIHAGSKSINNSSFPDSGDV